MGASGPLSINPVAMPKLSYDVLKDFVPIAQVHSVPLVVTANPQAGIASIKDLIAKAKASPGKISAASAGTGSMNHMAIELFDVFTGVKLTHVPYKGSGPALADEIGGQVMTMFDQVNSSMGYIRSGQIKPLAVTSPKRSAALPDVPTLNELGLKGYEAATFVGLLAPAGTPNEIVMKLNAAMRKTLQTPAVQQKLQDLGADVHTGSPEEFRTLIASELGKWQKVAKQAGIVLE
jgi:tripartite-type tricarboxylate transporter receptor subunit TctC